jgi:hypothetical protein
MAHVEVHDWKFFTQLKKRITKQKIFKTKLKKSENFIETFLLLSDKQKEINIYILN